ncbi:MAG: hypothetical protein OXI83_11125, partial [Gemmatimonadota bacterium]|nr:hypothetical protein [Gemmatimonadota bacterium]
MRPYVATLSRTALAATLFTSLAAGPGPAAASAQSGAAMDVTEPFKVGTFEIDGEPRVAMVLRDALVVDIGEANRALERNPAYPAVPAPADMLDLIGRYEYGVRLRLYEIVNHLAANGMIDGSARAGFIHELGDVRTLPPIMYPGKIMNAAVNFYS